MAGGYQTGIVRQMTDGILVIDKPEGMSSAKTVGKVKRIIRARKAGHAGTLDPFATGVLVCCLNRATKLARFFLHEEKKYEGVLRLGIETDTHDPTGKIISQSDDYDFSGDFIKNVFSEFQGEIRQNPPVYCALKHKGKPLYKYARQGRPVEKPPRIVNIKKLEIKNIDLPYIEFEVLCSGGTYVRTLAYDIGKKLGCGAHLAKLRRVASGRFSIKDAISLGELEETALKGRTGEKLISMNDALSRMESHIADNRLTRKIMYGNTIEKDEIPFVPGKNGTENLKVIDQNGRLLAVLSMGKESGTYDYCCVFPVN